jgi:hypothetical protein
MKMRAWSCKVGQASLEFSVSIEDPPHASLLRLLRPCSVECASCRDGMCSENKGHSEQPADHFSIRQSSQTQYHCGCCHLPHQQTILHHCWHTPLSSTADSLLQPVNFRPCGLIALHTPYNGNSYQVRTPRRNATYTRKMWKSDMRPW